MVKPRTHNLLIWVQVPLFPPSFLVYMKKPIKKAPLFVKYKTYFKYKIKNRFSKFDGTFLKFGTVGFQSLENFRITFREIEAMRRTIAFNHKQTKL